jgi:hypothetical protein
MPSQSDLFTQPAPAAEPTDQDHLRAHLKFYGWRTREQICGVLGWTERHLRMVAEEMGTEVVRCQRGFKLRSQLSREEISAALQGADAFISQGKKNIRYGLHLKRDLHAMIG